jgi:outer membrane protein OmpA-like peptidoglycan-associated protein/tetratricopeptide (TPR) repeat protein
MYSIQQKIIILLLLFCTTNVFAQNRSRTKKSAETTASETKETPKASSKSSKNNEKAESKKTQSKEEVKDLNLKNLKDENGKKEPGKFDQNVAKYKNIPYGKLLKYANKLEADGSYLNAVVYFEMAHKKKPNNKCIVQKLSELNYKLRDYEASQKYTELILEMDKGYDKLAPLRLAMCMKANQKYKQSVEEFKTLEENKKMQKYAKEIDIEKRGAELALEIRGKEDKKIKVAPESQVNGNLQEFAPQPLPDGAMIYSAIVSDTAPNITKMKEEGWDYTSKLLFTVFNDELNQWTKPQLLPQDINTPEVFIGNSFMDKTGKLIYYTQCSESKQLEMKCKLFMATKDGGQWKTEELKVLNAKGTTNTHPAIFEDGNKRFLLFSSDRPGGKGKMDIFYVAIDEKGKIKDKDATNLKEINSFNDDITPFYHTPSKTLYFSSNGYPSIGGFDVFKVQGTIGKWDKIINLKHPINSSLDDIYLKLRDDETGYFVSNRNGSKSTRGQTCCDDIWSIKKNEYNVWARIIYVSSKDLEKKPLSGVNSIAIDDNKKLIYNKTTEGESPIFVKLSQGKNYKVNGVLDGYYPGMDSFRTPNELFKDDTIYKIFVLDPIEKGKYVVENVYYAFDKSVVRPEYYSIMDSVYNLLQIFPDKFLKIDGHTDSRGTNIYNQALSERRCKAAAEYLLLKGLAPERIIMRGYSEDVPIAPNETPSNEDDPAGRAKNRRVEFKILAPTGKDPKLDIEYRVNDPFGID